MFNLIKNVFLLCTLSCVVQTHLINHNNILDDFKNNEVNSENALNFKYNLAKNEMPSDYFEYDIPNSEILINRKYQISNKIKINCLIFFIGFNNKSNIKPAASNDFFSYNSK